MAFEFTGKKILVTGASRGIGRGIAIALADAGGKVYALGRDKAALDALCTENANIVPVIQDLYNWEETRATLQNIEVLDGLVNNAGVLLGWRPAMEHSKDELEKYTAMHFLAPTNAIQTVAGKMIEEGVKGSIVNISGIDSFSAYPMNFGHGATKAALDMVTKQFALELGPKGIRVNSVNLTMVETEIFKTMSQEQLADVTRETLLRTPLGRYNTLKDVASPVMYLLSDHSAMVTGTTHVVDGGWTCNLTTKQ